jgi:hypothetical protein
VKQYLIQLSCFFVLVMAVLPSVTFVGHWNVQANAEAHTHTSSPAPYGAPDDSDHTQHCHMGPASCSGGIAMVGSVWVGEDAGPLAMNGSQLRLFPGETTLDHEDPASRILQPPRSAV